MPEAQQKLNKSGLLYRSNSGLNSAIAANCDYQQHCHSGVEAVPEVWVDAERAFPRSRPGEACESRWPLVQFD